MTYPDKNMERKERIDTEIIVDAYGPEEQAIGRHTYLSDICFSNLYVERIQSSSKHTMYPTMFFKYMNISALIESRQG